jgi:hypothetical protein
MGCHGHPQRPQVYAKGGREAARVSWRRNSQSTQYYRTQYSDELRSKSREDDTQAQEQFRKAKEDFRPLYYIRSYPSDKRKVEMSFDLTNYQPQVCRGVRRILHVTDSSSSREHHLMVPRTRKQRADPEVVMRPPWTSMFSRLYFSTSMAVVIYGARTRSTQKR